MIWYESGWLCRDWHRAGWSSWSTGRARRLCLALCKTVSLLALQRFWRVSHSRSLMRAVILVVLLYVLVVNLAAHPSFQFCLWVPFGVVGKNLNTEMLHGAWRSWHICFEFVFACVVGKNTPNMIPMADDAITRGSTGTPGLGSPLHICAPDT